MSTWIFQANPDRFDVDTYVGRQRQILWSVNQKHFRSQINVGDKVYIYGEQEAEHFGTTFTGLLPRG